MTSCQQLERTLLCKYPEVWRVQELGGSQELDVLIQVFWSWRAEPPVWSPLEELSPPKAS